MCPSACFYRKGSIPCKPVLYVDSSIFRLSRVHDFRHSFASILFENNTSLKDVSQLLGHGQTSTTERIYVHKKRVGNIESINTIANVIGF